MFKLLCKIFLCFVLVSTGWAQREEEILFLNLERSSAGLRLLQMKTAMGVLKPRAGGGSLEYEAISSEGKVTYSGKYADPTTERIEYADEVNLGRLRSILVTRDTAEFVIRVPADGTRKVRFYESSPADDRPGAFSSRRLMSELSIPSIADRAVRHSRNESANLSMILSNGPPGLRVNIVFLAEGYREWQEDNFTNQAKVVLNQMMQVSPYKEYKSHFNAFTIFVPSEQSGSDHPSRNSYRDTYFNSSYGVGSLQRLITIPPNSWNSNFGDGRGKVYELLAEFVPGYDIPLLLVNDTEYGGSGGVPAIASANVLSGELALHEIGHSFAGLADEYEEELPGYPDVESANATRQTTRETIRWRTWISDDVPVPTPKTAFYQDTIGLFEGAYFHPRGWYRPKMDCRMRNLSKPFCEICREAHVLTIYQLVEPILNSTPAPNNVTVPGGGELELFLETIEPASGTIGYTWTVNGATNEHFMGNFFTASFDTLGTGSHLVRANVSDTTAFVRNDPSARLSDSRNWLVTVVAPTNVPPVISEITDIVLELPQQSFGSVGFTVDDPDTPWHELQFRVSSSNPTLLSQEGIDIVGGKFGQFIQVHPDAEKTGLATVTLQISDGTTEVTQLFNVIVADAYSDLVLEPIFDQKVFLGPVAVSLSISRTSTSSLQFYGSSSNPEVVADSDISFEAVEERWIVHIHPEAEGETTLIVSVTDGVETAARSFQLTFVARPKVTSEMPRMTTEGLLVEFNTDIPATMILEYSMDLVFWMPVTSEADVTKLLYVAPESKTTNAGFYRVRVLPR